MTNLTQIYKTMSFSVRQNPYSICWVKVWKRTYNCLNIVFS